MCSGYGSIKKMVGTSLAKSPKLDSVQSPVWIHAHNKAVGDKVTEVFKNALSPNAAETRARPLFIQVDPAENRAHLRSMNITEE